MASPSKNQNTFIAASLTACQRYARPEARETGEV
jgi:hypothetical protein